MKAIILLLSMLSLSVAYSPAVNPPNATFEWEGWFQGDSPAGRPGGFINNWIVGQWRINVKAEREDQLLVLPPGAPESRFYSIKSVLIEIPFQYLAFPDGSLSSPLGENYLLELGSSEFDLTYPPNVDGVPNNDTLYNGSFVVESFDMPTAGAYSYQIFLKHNAQRVFITPKVATLTLGGGGVGIKGGFAISHFSYLPEMWSFWPDGTDFLSPPGYQNAVYAYVVPSPENFRSSCHAEETASVYKTVRFLDEENEGRYVRGAVADGRSRVIVELDGVHGSADVTIPSNGGDGTWVSEPTLLNGMWRRTWQVPESYGGSADDNIQGKRPIGFAVVIDGQSITPPAFNLYKAPVVLLHGIWGCPSDMENLQQALRDDGYQFVHSIQYPNQASFSANAWVPQVHVRHALDSAINQELVAKKADIVTYSMGGCIAKLYGHSSYIRRIVTIGTPHYGSLWADTLLYLQDNGINVDEILKLGTPQDSTPHSINAGAVSDLQEGDSGKHVNGNYLTVPALAIAGIYPHRDSLPPIDLTFGQSLQLVVQITGKSVSSLYSSLFGDDYSDWIVSKTSQVGGLSSVNEVVGPWHIEEPTNPEIISDTIAFLDKPSANVGAMIAQQSAPLTVQKYTPVQSVVRQFDSRPLVSNGIIITSPAAGTVFSPGDTVHVVVSAPANATTVFAALSYGQFIVDNTPPFEMDIPVPQQDLGELPIVVVGWDTNGIIGITSTMVNVTTTANIISLKVWTDSVLYLSPGETVPFTVHGVFSDGVERDITTSQCGTTYGTTDSSVASIDTNGVLTARAPGFCIVTVSNGCSMQIPVLVKIPALSRSAVAPTWAAYE